MPTPSTFSNGLLDLPGATSASQETAKRLLRLDEEVHHCFFNHLGFHNHLSHHILAAYDLGAPPALLDAIYKEEAKMQRPIDLKLDGITPQAAPKPGEIKDTNWTNWLGDEKAYQAYLLFFSDKVATGGPVKTLEDYVFSPAANGNGSDMLLRLVAGLLHPFIQVGFGLEFGIDFLVASGMAQAAVHDSRASLYIPAENFVEATPLANGTHAAKGRQPHVGPSLLSLLSQIYDSPKLVPVLPYDPDAFISKRVRDFVAGGTRLPELHRILAQYDPGSTPEALDDRVEEFIFVSTLLAFGTGKPNRKPRVDFFLMHMLTSALFVPSFLKCISDVGSVKALLRAYLQAWGMALMIRGRPRIDPVLLMSYTEHPAPPSSATGESQRASSAIGGSGATTINPWPAIIADVLHHDDSHTLKSLRTLLYGARRYGTRAKGTVIGAWDADGAETHRGIGEVDGTVFVRAAGVLMQALGWTTWPEGEGNVRGNWDRSALGWDDAWKGED